MRRINFTAIFSRTRAGQFLSSQNNKAQSIKSYSYHKDAKLSRKKIKCKIKKKAIVALALKK